MIIAATEVLGTSVLETRFVVKMAVVLPILTYANRRYYMSATTRKARA
jgi:hypothetical protein